MEIISLSAQLQMIRPREKMEYMGSDTLEHIEGQFARQLVYPYGEVYPGWYKENAKRAERQHGWYSTGEGARSFHYQVKTQMDAMMGLPEHIRISYFFNHYLSFVDYGVGKGRPLSKVQRSGGANRKTRYLDLWKPKQGKTHRPIFRRELRALKKRGARWLIRYTGNLYFGYVLRGMEGITDTRDYSGVHGGFSFENVEIK